MELKFNDLWIHGSIVNLNLATHKSNTMYPTKNMHNEFAVFYGNLNLVSKYWILYSATVCKFGIMLQTH